MRKTSFMALSFTLIILSLAGTLTYVNADFIYVTLSIDKSSYKQREMVTINGTVTDSRGNLVNDGLIAIEVQNPNKPILFRTLPLSTKISTSYFYMQIESLYPCDAEAKPITYVERGLNVYTFVYMQIKNNGIADRQVYVSISIVDSNSILLDSKWGALTVKAGHSCVFMPRLLIPNWSSTGTAKIYANIYSELPEKGGYPMSPEASANLQILESIYSDPPEENGESQLIQNGTYRLQFILPPDVLPGEYKVSVVAWYKGLQRSTSNTFNVTVIPSPPWPLFAMKPPSAGPGYSITFDASASSPEGYNDTIIEYSWNFGDGYTAKGRIVTHSYSSLGNYTVTLTVKDAEGFTNATSKKVTIVVIHDVAVLNIECLETIYDLWTVYVTVTVKNKGTVPETFTLKLYYNNTQGASVVVQLGIMQVKKLTLQWSTSGIIVPANYIIKVEAPVLENEANINDNTLTFGPVAAFKLGDITRDRIIDIYDVTCVNVLYDTKEGEPGWYVMVDLVRDGVIDIYDVTCVNVLYDYQY
ncbi:MAG: PKD domain-containing protein [Candidatus Bathyarchaeia archaeon]